MLSTQNQDQGKNVHSIPSYLYILASEIRQMGEKKEGSWAGILIGKEEKPCPYLQMT